MFKKKFILFLSILIIWFILLFLQIITNIKISIFCQFCEFIIDSLNIFLAYKIYINTKLSNKKTIIYLVLSMFLLLLVDIWYFLVYSVPNLSKYDIVFDIIHLLWYFVIILFLFLVLLQYIMNFLQISILISASIIDIIIFKNFSIKTYDIWTFSIKNFIFLTQFSAELLVFNLVILWLIYSRNMGASLIASGYTILMAIGFMFSSSYLSKMFTLLPYAELLWLLGLIFIMFGMVYVVNNQNYVIRSWFRANTIKSRLIFWSFSVNFLSIIILFYIVWQFSIINPIFYIFFPSIIIIYSLFVIYLSMLIGKTFEIPFKQIENNISMLMLNNENAKIENKFSIEEFIFLQQFIMEKFKAEKRQSRLIVEEQEKIKKTVKQMVHDITSPISSINTIVKKLGSSIPEDERITLRHAVERIDGISQKLLSQYDNKKYITNDNDEILLVALALLQIMNEKKEEYRESRIIFEVDIDKLVYFTFIKINSSIFKRMISNLINNAVDAVIDKSDAKIKIRLCVNSDRVIIIIKDNGAGMPKHIQDKFNEGVEVTEGKKGFGHGIGLTQVRDAIKIGGGTYDIHANEKYGTRITIWFPQVTTPTWIATEIKITKDDTIIILDDDNSIHGAWDSNFKSILEQNLTIKLKHFTQGKELITYIKSLTTEEKQNIFLLIDYELLKQDMNGLEVLAKTNIQRAILVTSYSTNNNIQNKVMKSGIKLLPKELASVVTIKVDKKIPRWSRNVDMVWVEDQEWFVNNLIKKYYAHLKIDTYCDPINFMENVYQYPLNTRIILDTYYETPDKIPYAIDGFDIAKNLHKMGYTNLILFAGEDPGNLAPNYLTVVLKSNLELTKHLDKV